MSERQTSATSTRAGRATPFDIDETANLAPAEPVDAAALELDLREHDNGTDAATVHEAPSELLSRRQAVEGFGLHPGIFSRWEKAGRLTPHRKTPRGRVYYEVAELKRAVSEQAVSEHAPKADDARPAAGLVLSPERLWAMVEEAREDALHARMRASAVEAEVRLLREMLQRVLSEPVDASTSLQSAEAAERARRWAGQWEQHEQQQQQHELTTRGSWWSRNP